MARASLSEIAQAAGATRGAIYWHFKDKVDLFNAMMDRATLSLEGVCNAGEAAYAKEPLVQLRGMVELLLRSVVGDAHMRRVFEIALYRVEYVSELSGVRERHLVAHARFQALLERNLSLNAQASLALPMSAAMAAAGLHALFNGLLQSWLLDEASFDLPATGRAAVDAYLRGLGFQCVTCVR